MSRSRAEKSSYACSSVVLSNRIRFAFLCVHPKKQSRRRLWRLKACRSSRGRGPAEHWCRRGFSSILKKLQSYDFAVSHEHILQTESAEEGDDQIDTSAMEIPSLDNEEERIEEENLVAVSAEDEDSTQYEDVEEEERGKEYDAEADEEEVEVVVEIGEVEQSPFNEF